MIAARCCGNTRPARRLVVQVSVPDIVGFDGATLPGFVELTRPLWEWPGTQVERQRESAAGDVQHPRRHSRAALDQRANASLMPPR